MCVSADGWGGGGLGGLEACRLRALRQSSDSEEEPPLLLVERGEFKFLPTTSCRIPLKEGQGGQCPHTDSGNSCYFNNQICCPPPPCTGGARRKWNGLNCKGCN